MINEADCVSLGLTCADVCIALDRVVKGGEANRFSRLVLETIEQLMV